MPNKDKKIHIDEKLCKGCYYCVEICPKKVLKKSNKLSSRGYILVEADNPNECIECYQCEKICPDFAISIKRSK
jgi:2-oxoglutarate ferredoxin oxidoreductase subunit delta